MCVTRTAPLLDGCLLPAGAAGQRLVAGAMERACASGSCDFVIGTGDSFYECGIDSPERWQRDWADVYQGAATPSLRRLKWFNVIGNHDIVSASK